MLYSNPGNYHRHVAGAATKKVDHKDAATDMPRRAFA